MPCVSLSVSKKGTLRKLVALLTHSPVLVRSPGSLLRSPAAVLHFLSHNIVKLA